MANPTVSEGDEKENHEKICHRSGAGSWDRRRPCELRNRAIVLLQGSPFEHCNCLLSKRAVSYSASNDSVGSMIASNLANATSAVGLKSVVVVNLCVVFFTSIRYIPI
jgi:hypothetical protein